jgi:chromosomal replication initiator protein
MDKEKTWQAILGELELSISKASFTTWFKNTHIIDIEGDSALIAVPNGFTKRWLENKYNQKILEALNNVLGNKDIKKLIFKISQDTKTEKETTKIDIKEINALKNNDASIVNTNNGFSLNEKYDFSGFITGKQNELAKAAAMAVAQDPGKIYNPLFLYGEVGLGKTHLMHAIGNEIQKSIPNCKLVYISSENFTNDFVKSIQSGNIDDFKKKYREADILLVDDIQFMKGQERTQEEFFHTFNALYQKNKQIVISSDRPPKSLPAIEDRLTSRFESGMIADIGHPDLETRVAILKSKIEEKNIHFKIADDVINYIANVARNNVRELEGALNRIIAVNQLSKEDITLESVKNILGKISPKQTVVGLTTKKVLKKVSEYFDVTLEKLTGSSRKKELVVPRQISMFLMRQELNASYPNIGNELGGRDHTTAIHAFNKITEEIKTNEKLKNDIELIKQRLYE